MCFNFGVRKEVVFILFTEQEKEEGGEFHSLQRFSPDLATQREFGYEDILYENERLSPQNTYLCQLICCLVLLPFFFSF